MYKESDYIKINKQAYDIVASEYITKYSQNNGTAIFNELITNFIFKKRKNDNHMFNMLEIGPGVGNLLKIFENNNFKTTAVELSLNMAKLSKQNSPDSIIINSDINSVSFLPKQFDFILCMALIHNFPEKDLITLLKNIKSWLKDDGYLILDTTNNPVTETGFFEKEDYNHKVTRYRKKWKKEDLEDFITNNGFYIEDSFIYRDTTTNKEWLVYSFKIS